MRNDIECPYCNEPLDINHDDGQGYEEDKVHEQQCRHCDKNFTFTTSIMYSYDAQQAPCLNDGEHDWTPIISTLKGRERCSYCDEERIADKELYEKSFRNEPIDTDNVGGLS